MNKTRRSKNLISVNDVQPDAAQRLKDYHKENAATFSIAAFSI
jgi:hypothetical protein